MANMTWGSPNWVAGTSLASVATDTAGSWSTGLPMDNILNRHLSKVARTTTASATSSIMRVNLGTERDVGIVALVSTNISVDGQVKATGYSDANYSTEVATTGWVDFWADAYQFGDRAWGVPDIFSSKLSAEDREGYPAVWNYIFSTETIAQYWQIEIRDEANTDGYIEVGRLVLARKWQPTVNMAYGAEISWETDTRVRRSRKGARFYDRDDPRRVLRFSIDLLPESETYSNPFEIVRRQGLDGEIFVIFDPDDEARQIRRSFLANLRELPSFGHPVYDRMTFDAELEEIVA